MAASEPRQIEWGSAQMRDGTLTVELTGANSKAWTAQFEVVLALLDTPHSDWGEVSLRKKAIEVADVPRGSESELRHFLESIVLQANADTEPDSPEQTANATDTQDDHANDPADEQMTATFRSFANA